MEFNQELSDFLSEAPLYTKFETDITFTSPYDFQDFGLRVFCNKEQTYTTHSLSIYPETTKDYFGAQPAGMPTNVYANSKTESRPFTQHYQGLCNSCQEHRFDVLIDIKSVVESNISSIVSKLGQYPPFKISPDKSLIKYLSPESLELYRKALLNQSQGYGIGAFAYFRRITEDLLLTFLKDISDLDYDDSKIIKELIEKHNQNHDMASLVDSVFKFLPDSLKSLGNNPIKFLYGQLSVGLHKLTEEECYKKSKSLDRLLTFVIKKIMEERTEISTIRKLMRQSE